MPKTYVFNRKCLSWRCFGIGNLIFWFVRIRRCLLSIWELYNLSEFR